MSCSELALDVGYLSKIPDRAQPQEVSALCSFSEIGACGLQTRVDGRPCEGRGDSKLGSAKECETVVHYSRTHKILRKFIKGYAQITMPMEKLLKKDVTFYWNDDYKKSLDILK